MRPAPAAPIRAAAIVAAALLALGCAVSPSPPASGTPPPSGAASPTPTGPATAPPGAGLHLVSWERRGGGDALTVRMADGTAAILPLPEPANGPIAGGPEGRLAFAAGPLGRGRIHTAPLPGPDGPPEWGVIELPGGLIAGEATLRRVCLGRAGRLAAQADDGALVVVEPDGSARALERFGGVPRGSGCAWLDERHLLYAVEGGGAGPGFAIADVVSGEVVRLDAGGDGPAVSPDGKRLAYLLPGGIDRLLAFGAAPAPDGAGGVLPAPFVRLAPPGGGGYDVPVISADGRWVAALARDPGFAPVAFDLYRIEGEAAGLMGRIDVAGAGDAAVAWLAGGE